jgi:hypothetical protein
VEFIQRGAEHTGTRVGWNQPGQMSGTTDAGLRRKWLYATNTIRGHIREVSRAEFHIKTFDTVVCIVQVDYSENSEKIDWLKTVHMGTFSF